MKILFKFILLLTVYLCGNLQVIGGIIESEVVTDQYVNSSLIFPYSGFGVGEDEYYLFVKLEHEKGWHTYWINPGDSGYETSIEWDLPEGVIVSEILWPVPEALDFFGLTNYGYEESVYLVVKLSISDKVKNDVSIKASVAWLMCEKVCIPGSVDLMLNIPFIEESTFNSGQEVFIGGKLNKLSSKLDAEISVFEYDGSYYLQVQDLSELSGDVYIFNKNLLVNPSAKQKVEGDFIILEKSVYAGEDTNFEGVVGLRKKGSVVYNGEEVEGVYFNSEIIHSLPPVGSINIGEFKKGGINLLSVVVLAFIGGLILNLMPCVFPVIGLKIMGFVNQAGADKKVIVNHGMVFTLGILISFWIIAIILLLLRASGEEFGWGFQLQSSIFVWALVVVLFVFGLSLSGLFEVGLKVTAAGGKLITKSGYTGTFYSGVLATVVATPCAAPFLAPALGAALMVPPFQSLVVFTFIGLGLATPYILLSIFPILLNYLPKPGAWMESFKQAMAFLLYATVGYLMWVLVGQLTDGEQLYAVFGLVFIATACWIYGRWFLNYSYKYRKVMLVVSVTFMIIGISLGVIKENSDIHWEAWSEDRVVELVNDGRPIYVDFTARWCATCQVNKRVVFGSDEVNKFFIDNNVAALVADWTKHDKKITRELAKYQRSAVPFNLAYKKGSSEPVILPELLTPEIVLNAFE